MINDFSTGYWDYSNDVAPQWVEYGSPGAKPAPGPINVGGTGSNPPVTGTGGMPVGGSNPILSTYGPPSSYANPVAGNQFTPNPFMTPGLTLQPRTQFGQQASAPLNINQQGRTYGQMPGGPNVAQPQFMPQFQNPFGPQTQPQPPGGEIGIGDFMRDQMRNAYGPQSQQPQQYTPMGQPPTQISQQPTQRRITPASEGLLALLREQYPRPS